MHLQDIYKVKINHFRFHNLRQLLVSFNEKFANSNIRRVLAQKNLAPLCKLFDSLYSKLRLTENGMPATSKG